ncbi:MAG: hypothetical protein ABII79_10540 [bacterium]
MHKHLLILVAVLLLAPMATGGEAPVEEGSGPGHAGCPANRAAELGHDPFHQFHKILAPVWHEAWPDKDYESLLLAGSRFAEAFVAIAKMEPTFKSLKRQQDFMKYRDEFAKYVKAYSAAAERGEKDKVYELMPGLHDAFEMTASTLLPVSYPEIEALAVTLDLIVGTHMPKDNLEGIVGSTETLLNRFSVLADTASVPVELKDHQAEIMRAVAVMKKLAMQMKECCDKKDMETYKSHAAILDEVVKKFYEKYI